MILAGHDAYTNLTRGPDSLPRRPAAVWRGTRYGYRAEFVDPKHATWSGRGPKPKKVVVIYEPEAESVRAIFAWFVGGMSIGAITRKLNELGATKGHRCSRPGWHHQIVRRILGNTKYIGQWTWGRTQTRRDSRGRKRPVPVEESAVVKQDRPDLRIIDDATWAKAQKLLRQLDEIYGKKPHQQSRAAKVHHPELYPVGLLNGLIFCELCGARMVIQQSIGRKYLG